jgi:cytoskeletal protein CcmA (bactofilin family)
MVFRSKMTYEPEQSGEESQMRSMPARLSPVGSNLRSGEDGTGERKRLTLGPGISLSGEITDCDRLVIRGNARVTLHRVRALEIAETGRFTDGKAEVEEAEVGGVYDGELTVRGRLLIRSTGRVTGTVHYGEIEIERGGGISGSVEAREPTYGPEGGRVGGPAAEMPTKISNLRPADIPASERDRGSTTGNSDGQELGPLSK